MSRIETDIAGNRRWYNERGKLHREDGPAVEFKNGTRHWRQHGQFHRVDGPAVEYVSGNQWWYQRGKLHRVDGPAVVDKGGASRWYIYDVWRPILKLDTLARRIQSVFWRAWRRRRSLKQSCLEELLVHPPRGMFPGGWEYQQSVTHFESLKL